MVAELNFIGQPSSQDSTLAAFLERALADTSIESLTVVVAWARFRGLVRLRAEIEAFRGRGGTTRLIVGIDEGGATRPGLLLASRIFDRAHVFHDPAGGTFHPKVYLAEGREQALLVVGSSNATPGGWFSNYEASLEARFALPQEAADRALRGAKQYVKALLAEEQLCFELSEELVDRLVRDRRYRVAGNERPRRGAGTSSNGASDAADVDVSGSTDEPGGAQPLFGARAMRRIFAPPLSAEDRRELAALEIPSDDEAEADSELPPPSDDAPHPPADGVTAARPSSAPGVAPTVIWTKVLPRGDAQQQTASKTNLTANVRLTKARHDIDWRTWFRNTLFGTAAWRSDTDIHNNPIERADVPFMVKVDGVSFGTIDLEVTHAPHREAGQANHTTVLRWGQLLNTLQATDYTGYTLTLERMSDGTYRLDISQ